MRRFREVERNHEKKEDRFANCALYKRALEELDKPLNMEVNYDASIAKLIGTRES